jgi:hypothetical protein
MRSVDGLGPLTLVRIAAIMKRHAVHVAD